MKVFTDCITVLPDYSNFFSLASYFSKYIKSLEDIVFFDIETTGFSAKNSICYLIGAVNFQNGQPVYTQWFADTPDSESELLNTFFNFLSSFKCIVHFNGNHFDIPFLLERAKLLNIPHELTKSFSECDSIDIFKLVKGCNSLLNLEHYNQKSLEQFIGLSREDKFDGGELIEFYKKYVVSKDNRTEKLLLLHNHDDICGLLSIFPLTAYCQLYDKAFTLQACEINEAVSYEGISVKELILTAKTQLPVSMPLSLQKESFHIRLKDNCLRVQVPLFEGRLKLFYKDYKNYYYLPDEDMALHKSVAAYVDKSHRRQAKAANCYTWVSGVFMPEFRDTAITIKHDYSDKLCHTLLTDEFMQSLDLQSEYLLSIVSHIL